nr:PAN-1 domain containing protein [Haemonchus contortus]
MFAVAGVTSPFTLVEYEGRDYFEYLAAIPPSDDELTEASNLAMQERINSEKKGSKSCEVERLGKTPLVRRKKANQDLYGARPIHEQLEADEKETKQKDKQRRKKTNKLQKVTKEEELATIIPPVTDVQAAFTGEILVESKTISPEKLTTVMETEEDISLSEGSSLGELDIAATTEETTAAVRVIRRKPAKKLNDKTVKHTEAVRSRMERNEGIVGGSSGNKQNKDLRVHKRKGAIRRKPVNPPKEFATGAPYEKLSTDVARIKIKTYQQRKAAGALFSTLPPRRERVRLQGLRLTAVNDDETFRHGKVSRKETVKNWQEGSDKGAVKRAEQHPLEGKETGERAKKQPKSRGTSKRRGSKATVSPTTATPRTTSKTTKTTTTPAAAMAAPLSDITSEKLRVALRREIRKFVSRELKQKGFRVHGAKISDGDDPEHDDNPTTHARKPHHSDDISLELADSTDICEENEHVVMMSFPSSTRKPYKAVKETVKARDHRQCLEQCEGNPDCSSAIFSNSMCEMSATRVRHSVADLQPAENGTYIEKSCIDKMLVKGRSTHLIGVANHILAGFVEQIEDVYGIEQCISACYAALKRYGFQCMSAMWYPNDKEQNCLLNTETKKTQPGVFIPEDTGTMMVYFEHPDELFMRRLHDEMMSSSMIRKPDEQWTTWSSCHGKKEKTRYQKCYQYVDIRKCPKETAPCSSSGYAQHAEKHIESNSG